MKISELAQRTKHIEILQAVSDDLFARRDRSAWDRGVNCYAIDLVDFMINNIEYFDGDITNSNDIKDFLLNGARNWKEYSWGGSTLIYDEDIAKTLCAPWELKKTKNGELKPNKNEEWLDVQARALYQAFFRVDCAIAKVLERGKTND